MLRHSRFVINPARLFLILALVLTTVGLARAEHPVPNTVAVRWELEYKPGELRLFVDSHGDTYWYFTYMVTNHTGDDQVWAPMHTLFTEDGEILRSGQNVPTSVNREILAMFENELLETQNQIIGDLFQGVENAREGLVIWTADNLNVTDMSLFVSGISGETDEITHPITGERIVFQKTLQRDYRVPGDPLARGDEPAEFLGQRWIMR